MYACIILYDKEAIYTINTHKHILTEREREREREKERKRNSRGVGELALLAALLVAVLRACRTDPARLCGLADFGVPLQTSREIEHTRMSEKKCSDRVCSFVVCSSAALPAACQWPLSPCPSFQCLHHTVPSILLPLAIPLCATVLFAFSLLVFLTLDDRKNELRAQHS